MFLLNILAHFDVFLALRKGPKLFTSANFFNSSNFESWYALLSLVQILSISSNLLINDSASFRKLSLSRSGSVDLNLLNFGSLIYNSNLLNWRFFPDSRLSVSCRNSRKYLLFAFNNDLYCRVIPNTS